MDLDILEKARLYDEAKAKHNARCYKYYEDNREKLREKRNAYSQKYYKKRKSKGETLVSPLT